MSRFLSKKHASLVPYTPGEQPRERLIKLNTNESPFPPPARVAEAAEEAAKHLHLYCDPECKTLVDTYCKLTGVGRDEVLFTNGSDEILNFAFLAFCDEEHPALFPNISYGFYKVFAALNGVPYRELALRDDLTVNVEDYIGVRGTIFLANPNAPTGISLPLSEIERIVASNPDSVVVIDEAYVDFGGESAVSLIRTYDNLLVTQTFSKSRSMAGARLGMGIASPALIRDLNTIKYSTNPYNVDSVAQAAGVATLLCEEEIRENCRTVCENREWAAAELARLGFSLTPSKANFLFAAHPRVSGQRVYEELRARGILVRHFQSPEIAEYNRITVGSRAQMEALVAACREIVGA